MVKYTSSVAVCSADYQLEIVFTLKDRNLKEFLERICGFVLARSVQIVSSLDSSRLTIIFHIDTVLDLDLCYKTLQKKKQRIATLKKCKEFFFWRYIETFFHLEKVNCHKQTKLALHTRLLAKLIINNLKIQQTKSKRHKLFFFLIYDASQKSTRFNIGQYIHGNQ